MFWRRKLFPASCFVFDTEADKRIYEYREPQDGSKDAVIDRRITQSTGYEDCRGAPGYYRRQTRAGIKKYGRNIGAVDPCRVKPFVQGRSQDRIHRIIIAGYNETHGMKQGGGGYDPHGAPGFSEYFFKKTVYNSQHFDDTAKSRREHEHCHY